MTLGRKSSAAPGGSNATCGCAPPLYWSSKVSASSSAELLLPSEAEVSEGLGVAEGLDVSEGLGVFEELGLPEEVGASEGLGRGSWGQIQ
ncbi:hypothetical protein N8I84_21860 [Streptomyces cynarae]|uniref:Uncharacterized protein n=1 Tax=Streptomyces cynarae TaxID=2981134 RepID=A0ABY6E2Z7_9ACTN|nr:hypothetical protein [Streptomyces cynarae]UXY21040.1 hypothetical protein N8I84_21860 [Streptomyces cynarae]